MKHILSSAALLLIGFCSSAQNVGIGTTSFTPNDDALLELRSTSSGFLLPKMTEAQKNAISGPTEGLIVYQTNATKGFKYFNGAVWTEFGGGADNFGSHEAEMNISLDDHWLSNDGGNEGIRIADNGNVGIGTASPTAALHVQVNANGLNLPLFLRNFNGTSVDNGIGIGFNSEQNGDWVKAAVFHERTSNYGVGKLHFLLNNQGSTQTVSLSDSRMTIMSNGNIGIGTTSPVAKLHTKGSVRMETLAGSGTRMVVADNLGNVSTQAIPSGGGGFGSGTTLNLNLTNDVTSQNVSGVSIIRLDSNNSSNEIKGLSGGVAGQIICVVNTDPNHKVKFKKDQGTQRFREDVEVDKKDGAIIMYDGSYWYVLSRH